MPLSKELLLSMDVLHLYQWGGGGLKVIEKSKD